MQNRRVIPTAKSIANFGQAVLSQLFGHGHGHLPWTSNRAVESVGHQVFHLDIVVLWNGLFDVIQRDLSILQGQQILEAFLDEVDVKRAPSESRTRNDALERAL